VIKLLVIASILSLGASANAAVPKEQRWDFNVLLDQQKIGEHTFIVRHEQDAEKGPLKTVEIEANFNVKILFINAYSYQHTNRESWQGNCLVALSSQTNDNGDDLAVRASTQDQQFVVQTQRSTDTFDACPMSFAYWNPAFLTADALINAQTGELEPVKITPLGSERITVAGETFEANHYALELEEQTIELWYAADDYRWLALETPARGNRTLRYEATALPVADTQANQQVATPPGNGRSELTNAMAY
jgi:uncharacterized protein DUF6134